jgi:predicted cupin superfamily sugar epimerase
VEELQSIIARLGLAPLPFEGGWFRQYYVSEERDAARRPRASAIHYVISPKEFSAMHRLKTPEAWTFRDGAPLEMLLLPRDGAARLVRLGADKANGETLTVDVPANCWQGARTLGAWSLLDCRMEPAWDAREFELGRREELIARHPAWADVIRTMTRQK